MATATGVAGLQTARQFLIDPEQLLQVARADRPSDLRPHHVREVPELTVPHLEELLSGDVTVLGHLLFSSLEEGCCLWLTHVSAERLAELRTRFGPDLVHEVGLAHEGVVPIALNPEDVTVAWAKDPDRAGLLRDALRGLDSVRLPHRVVRALIDADVDFVHHGWWERTFKNPKVLAYIVVLAYSALRALPVSLVKEFHGSLVMLWTIDIVTAIPYTWGVLAMVTAKRFAMRLAGIVVTTVTFCSPYIYFWFHGRHYPRYVIVVIAALVLGGILLEGWKIARDRRITRALVSVQP